MAIVNGHAAGTLRRIETNGVDWIKIKPGFTKVGGVPLQPGPVSSYMIITKEDAKTQSITSDVEVPLYDSQGVLVDDPDIDYEALSAVHPPRAREHQHGLRQSARGDVHGHAIQPGLPRTGH